MYTYKNFLKCQVALKYFSLSQVHEHRENIVLIILIFLHNRIVAIQNMITNYIVYTLHIKKMKL